MVSVHRGHKDNAKPTWPWWECLKPHLCFFFIAKAKLPFWCVIHLSFLPRLNARWSKIAPCDSNDLHSIHRFAFSRLYADPSLCACLRMPFSSHMPPGKRSIHLTLVLNVDLTIFLTDKQSTLEANRPLLFRGSLAFQVTPSSSLSPSDGHYLLLLNRAGLRAASHFILGKS